jgi:carbon-monoxide dehydrogenase small subunit
MKAREITLSVNGRRYSGQAEPRMTLLDFLRDVLGLTGTHAGCEHGVCGACSIILDGDAMRSCLIFAVQAEGSEVETVEGLCAEGGTPGPLQDCFRDAHGLQCGYCTPGMLITAQALLRANPDPSDDQIRGNICRCTGYAQIIDAVRLAAVRLNAGHLGEAE